MQKTMFFDRFGTTNIAAVVEAGKLVEFHADGQTDRDTAGNIYKGRVVNVLAGMQAAFVAYGADRNGYLAAGGEAEKLVTVPTLEAAQDLLEGELAEGDTVLILEAMKMETEIKAEKAGIVREINVAVSQVVTAGETLAMIEEK